MKNPILSICIPTYNREQFLNQALESIINETVCQNHENIEICISDNQSTDNTSKVIENWRLKSAIPIHVHYNETNLGADLNFLSVINMARGKYCWFLGSDDIIEPGSISYLLEQIETYPDNGIFILNHYIYDKDLNAGSRKYNSIMPNINETTIFRESREIIESLGYCFGYISILVFNRSLWEKADSWQPFIGSCYVHVYKLMVMIQLGASVIYLPQPIVGFRSNNDSFLANLKEVGRLKLDIKGYDEITAAVFGTNSQERYLINRIVFLKHIVGRASNIIVTGCSFAVKMKISYMCLLKYYRLREFWVKLVPYLILPSYIIRTLKRLVTSKSFV